MHELITRLGQTVGYTGRLGLKLPPYMGDEGHGLASDLAKILRENDVFRFLVTSNTIPNQVARNAAGDPILTVPEGKGGMSGPRAKDRGQEQLRLWRGLISSDIVSTLGVDSGTELARRLHLGATAAGGVTFLWESRNWKAAVTNMLSEFAAMQEQV